MNQWVRALCPPESRPLPPDVGNAPLHRACPVLWGIKSNWNGLLGKGWYFDKQSKQASERASERASKQAEWENAPKEEQHRVYREQ